MAVNVVAVAKAAVVNLSVAKITSCKLLVVVHKAIAPLMTTVAVLLVVNAVMQQKVVSKHRAHLVRHAHRVHHARRVTQIVMQRKRLIAKLLLKQLKPIPQLISTATSLQPLRMPRVESAVVAIAILRAASADHANAIRKY
jgi:hypothetical protein